jgi:HD-like signal output (HDOD) protein/ActR/RegA family two-component response regulator
MGLMRDCHDFGSERHVSIMVSLMLVAENERESQILKMAFEQRGITVLASKAKYQNYVKALQYLPDLILIEMPRPHMEQLHFAALLKNHKKARRIPIIGYGDAMDPAEKNGIVKVGVNYYFARPLKFTQIIKVIETLLKQFNKNLDAGPAAQDKEKDIELLLATDTMPMKKIEIMTSYVSSMLAFPFTVAKVLSLAESLKSAASDLARVIESDPVLSTQILKLSNSVLFASLNRRISTIKDAIVRIGFKETKRLVMSVSVMKLFDQANKSLGFDRVGFWWHSLAAGIIAERLARRVGTVNSDEVFLAGLLHDFGIIVLDEFFPTLFSKILEDTTNSGGLFIEREKALLGIHHNDVLGELFTKWKLPDLVREGIVRQHDAESYVDAIDAPEKKYAVCVAMANILAKTVSLGRECDQYVTPLPGQFFSFAKMPTGFTRAFLDEVYNEMNVYREFLRLDIPDASAKSEGVVLSDKTRIGIVNLASDVFVPPFLFYQKEGFAIKLLETGGDCSKYTSSFDVIHVWAGAQTTREQVAPFSRIVKFAETPPPPQAQPEFAPVLVLLPPENAPAFRDLNAGQSISCAYNRLDIRQLDKFLSTILMGKTTSLADIDTQRKTRVSFDTVKAVASQRNQAGAVAGDAKAAQEGPQPAATPSSVEETP